MNLQDLASELPEYAKDIKLNLSSLQRATELSDTEKWGTFLACAEALGHKEVLAAVHEEAKNHLSEEEIHAACGAAAIMAMNNIYYRFAHLSENKKYLSIPAGLRMNMIRSHGVDEKLFELWSLAVSALNGCGMCIQSHEKVLREKGTSEEAILAAVRIASVLHATSAVLNK